MKSIFKRTLALLLIIFTLLPLVSCSLFYDASYDSEPDSIGSSGLIDESMFIVTEGDKLKTLCGDVVTLRGVNIGGLFVTENWMNAIFQHTKPRTANA